MFVFFDHCFREVLTFLILNIAFKDLFVGLDHVPHLNLAEHFVNQATFVRFSNDLIYLSFVEEVLIIVFKQMACFHFDNATANTVSDLCLSVCFSLLLVDRICFTAHNLLGLSLAQNHI